MADLAKASHYGLAERPYISNHSSLTAHSARALTLCAAARNHSLSRRRQLQETKIAQGEGLLTLTCPTALRAKTSGRYMSEAFAPGAENAPVEVARTK